MTPKCDRLAQGRSHSGATPPEEECDPPCARQVALVLIQGLLLPNLSPATSKGYIIWSPREKARPALRKAGRIFRIPPGKNGATWLAQAWEWQTQGKHACSPGARQVAHSEYLPEKRSATRLAQAGE